MAIQSKGYCGVKVESLMAEAKAAGEQDEWPAVSFAGALLEMRNRLITTAAASRADASGTAS